MCRAQSNASPLGWHLTERRIAAQSSGDEAMRATGAGAGAAAAAAGAGADVPQAASGLSGRRSRNHFAISLTRFSSRSSPKLLRLPAPRSRQRVLFDEPRQRAIRNGILRQAKRSSSAAPSEALPKRQGSDCASEAREQLLRDHAAVREAVRQFSRPLE